VEQRGKARGDEYLFNLDLFALDAVDHGLQQAGLRRKAVSSASASTTTGAAAGATAADGSSTSKAKEREEAIRNGVLDEVEGSGFLLGIDAKHWGNVGRFFNHSCAPNMEKQPVFSGSQDVRLPSLAFFTNCDVPAGTELTYNYGYKEGSVEGKQMVCRCGEPGCTGVLY